MYGSEIFYVSCCITFLGPLARKGPRVTSAVVAIVDDDQVLLVELETAGFSILSAFVPVIGGQEQWTHYDATSHPLRRKQNHMCGSVWFMFVLCLFVCLELFVLPRRATQQHSVLSRRIALKRTVLSAKVVNAGTKHLPPPPGQLAKRQPAVSPRRLTLAVRSKACYRLLE